MKYVSTRGQAPALSFNEALLAGLANDGGLYVPQVWPRLSEETIGGFAGAPYTDVAYQVMRPFIGGDVPAAALQEMIFEAYESFSHPAVAPLVQLAPNRWVLELFHGPTLAFKDVAMQIVSRLMDRVLKARGARITIVVATSGDTGGAAIEAFRGRDAIDLFVLHPNGCVSEVQRRQMTTAKETNVHNIALEGTFDDCQAFVKALFNDPNRREALHLAGVNSINWARIMAQVVYYFTSATAIGAPERAVSFSVPTGNFGDIFAGYVAKRMGLPVKDLVIATNSNDILARTVESGRYEPRKVVASTSPSMDIQVSSNFERLVFEMCGRDGARVRTLMGNLAQQGAFELNEAECQALRAEFSAVRATEETVEALMAMTYRDTRYLLDPHSATGVYGAAKMADSDPVIALGTAHPAKFPEAVTRYTGLEVPHPPEIEAAMAREERYTVLENNFTAIADHIAGLSRVTGVTA